VVGEIEKEINKKVKRSIRVLGGGGGGGSKKKKKAPWGGGGGGIFSNTKHYFFHCKISHSSKTPAKSSNRY